MLGGNKVNPSIIQNKEIYVDGIYINFHKLGYFSRKSALKKAMVLKHKFDFLTSILGYHCYSIDIPGIFDITIISYKKDECPEIQVTLERKNVELTMVIENEKISIPLIYYVYNHNQSIRCSVNDNCHYIEDYTKYIFFLLENKEKLNKREIDEFYKKNPAYKIQWLS